MFTGRKPKSKRTAWKEKATKSERRKAKSAVTGGDPEDINMMPPDTDHDSDSPVFDGSGADSKVRD